MGCLGSKYRGADGKGAKTEQGALEKQGVVEMKGVIDKKLKIRGVIFVEQAPRGELACVLREQLNYMGATLGFRLRVVERTGRSLLSCIPQTRTWGGVPCASPAIRKEIISQNAREGALCTKVFV